MFSTSRTSRFYACCKEIIYSFVKPSQKILKFSQWISSLFLKIFTNLYPFHQKNKIKLQTYKQQVDELKLFKICRCLTLFSEIIFIICVILYSINLFHMMLMLWKLVWSSSYLFFFFFLSELQGENHTLSIRHLHKYKWPQK